MAEQERKPLPVRSLDDPLSAFDLQEELDQVRREDAWAQAPRASRGLVNTRGLRMVLLAMHGGTSISAHRADGPITVHVLDGRIRFTALEHAVMLRKGQVLSLEAGVAHAVDAPEDAAFLLTVATTPAA